LGKQKPAIDVYLSDINEKRMHDKKTVLVTGGNRGIGLEICRQLAGMGHHVIMGSRDLDKGLAAAKTLPGKVDVRELDVASEASIVACAGALVPDFPKLDVLIHNAGVLGDNDGTTKVTLAALQIAFMTNTFGPLLLSQQLLPLLRKSAGGRIIHLSSEMGQMSALGGGHAAYRLSKASLNALTISMARELRPDGILVNAMCPGWVKTDMGGAGAMRSVSVGADTAVWLATADDIPTGKFFRDRKEMAW
jgi:NAD(P)-dependent dehydrogenase (short-subunit alcohol dehydrogenase family)